MGDAWTAGSAGSGYEKNSNPDAEFSHQMTLVRRLYIYIFLEICLKMGLTFQWSWLLTLEFYKLIIISQGF